MGKGSWGERITERLNRSLCVSLCAGRREARKKPTITGFGAGGLLRRLFWSAVLSHRFGFSFFGGRLWPIDARPSSGEKPQRRACGALVPVLGASWKKKRCESTALQ